MKDAQDTKASDLKTLIMKTLHNSISEKVRRSTPNDQPPTADHENRLQPQGNRSVFSQDAQHLVRRAPSGDLNREEEPHDDGLTHQDECGQVRPRKRRRTLSQLPDKAFEQRTDSWGTEFTTSQINISGIHTRDTLSTNQQNPHESNPPQGDAVPVCTSGEQVMTNDPAPPVGFGEFVGASATQDQNEDPVQLGLDDRDWDAEFANIDLNVLEVLGSMAFLEENPNYSPRMTHVQEMLGA